MAAREVFGATGGFPAPAVELEVPGLEVAPFFTILVAATATMKLHLIESSRAQGGGTEEEDELCEKKEENLAVALRL